MGGQCTVKRQKLDESANPMAAGASVATAIPIDDGADDNNKDDNDDIKILIDKDDDKK